MFVRTCLGAAYSRSLVQVQPYLEDRRRVVRAKLCFELRPPPPPPLRCCCCCRGHRSFRGCFDEAGQKKRRSYSASSFSISEKATFASPGITKIKVSCKKPGQPLEAAAASASSTSEAELQIYARHAKGEMTLMKNSVFFYFHVRVPWETLNII